MRALITGGSKGIGRAVALRAGAEGGRVLVNYHGDQGAADRTVAEIEAGGGTAQAVRADACSAEGAAELATVAERELGGLDLLVHCAVTAYSGGALTADESALRESIERNGLSLAWLVRSCAPLLAPGASVVFLTSGGATRAVPNYAPLGVAKAVGESLVRYLAAELAGRGVRVNGVSAGTVDTDALRAVMPDTADQVLATIAERSPSKRVLEPDDVAGVVMSLASSGTSMVQGQVIRVDGGLGLI